ncbi:transposase family protein [Streptomyces sp. NPDC005393]|uniref:transposase family protein n=1 Tax=Streptomyces sp. NPDC005393 TaxID=3157041 RepID=UPI0033AE0A95
MPSCLIEELARTLDALEVPLDQDTLAGSAEVTTLLDALTLVPDPRRRQGCRYSFTGLLSVTAAAVMCGARSPRSCAGHAAPLPPCSAPWGWPTGQRAECRPPPPSAEP